MAFNTREQVQIAEIIQDDDIINHELDSEGDELSAISNRQTLSKLARNLFGLLKLLGEKNRRRNHDKFHGRDINLTGTITSSGIQVTGSGTKFTSELQVGDFISGLSGEYREILSISSDTLLTLTMAFTSDITTGQSYKRISFLAERIGAFTEGRGTITGDIELNSTNPPTIKSGSYHVVDKILQFESDLIATWSTNYGNNAPEANNWYLIGLDSNGSYHSRIAVGNGYLYGLNISSISNPVGSTMRYYLSGSPDLSSVNVGDIIHSTDCNDSINDGVFVISAVDDTNDYIEVTNTNGTIQSGANGNIDICYPVGNVAGGGTDVRYYNPELIFNDVYQGYYDNFLDGVRIIGIFYVNGSGNPELPYALGNGREWKEAEGIPVGATFSLNIDHEPPWGYEENGGLVDVTKAKRLFDKIGFSFGGSGSQFRLDDKRGYQLRGWDHGRGLDPDASSRTDRGDGIIGDNVGTKQLDAMQGHRHSLSPGNVASDATSGSTSQSNQSGSRAYSLISILDPIDDGTHGTPRISYETRGRNTNVMFIIKK